MSSDPIKDIFKDVLSFEEQVLGMYGDISLKTKNEKIKAVMREIMKDEAKHAQNARQILTILDEPDRR
jgi:rubrerythrin